MYTHVVLFRVKDPKDASTVAEVLRSMEGQIPELQGLEVGLNDISSQRNYDVVLITRFLSKEEMQRYQVSAYHQEQVLQRIRPLIAMSAAGDFPSA
ncbi:hypothetical protein ABB02_01110 [Clostridiaceae bacterium JG1575]|nr:hypothetical protein ABB02_01110 [Clostridiaceae bacterium JG1575]